MKATVAIVSTIVRQMRGYTDGRLEISQTQDGFRVEGFPDAVRLIRLDGPQAQRLADLALHRADLEFALDCLDAVNDAPNHPSPIRQALWRAAIVHFGKCFGFSHSRDKLSSDQIFGGDALHLEVFQYFKDLRDKHVTHDENPFSQSQPAAVLNSPQAEAKIPKIVGVNMTMEKLTTASFGNLHLLCSTARDWVAQEFENLSDCLIENLERKAYEELVKMPEVRLDVPQAVQMSKRRSRI